MPVEKNINFKIDELTVFKTVITTYELIAASAMQKVRDSVLANREFHIDLNTVFKEVRAAYQDKLNKIERRKKVLRKIVPSGFLKFSKKIYVLLSANTGLYGSIIAKTLDLFVDEIEKVRPDEIAIIGKVGDALFKSVRPKNAFTYFDFPDADISIDALKKISKYLSQFTEVVVFHGSFKSILTQVPVYASVSGSGLESQNNIVSESVRYRFEPALEEVFKFFETEIFASLLEQVFHESRLAKLASRLVLLDNASGNIDRFLEQAIFEGRRAKHRDFNRRQINTYSSFALWV